VTTAAGGVKTPPTNLKKRPPPKDSNPKSPAKKTVNRKPIASV
jgi:hypothetical protein